MAYEGMDPEEQRSNAGKMQKTTAAAHAAVQGVAAHFADTDKFGPWVQQFAEDMYGIFMPQMHGIVNAMNDNAAVLLRRAQMQEDASRS